MTGYRRGKLPFTELDDTVSKAISVMNEAALGIVLIVDPKQRLLDTITDGDMRRAFLAGITPDSLVRQLWASKAASNMSDAVTASVGSSESNLRGLLKEHSIRHIPMVDEDDHVVDIVVLSDLMRDYDPPPKAVIMAGGFGTRLHPLTEDTPKPMLRVGDRPIMEHIVRQLHVAGVQKFDVTTHYRADAIRSHFGDGRQFGVAIDYVHEEEPMGTAGGLSLLTDSDETLLVVNGDILTQIDYRSLIRFHRDNRADMTIAMRKYDMKVPYGVVQCNGSAVERLTEKPNYSFFVNAGIYLIEPSVMQYLPNTRIDMTDFVSILIEKRLSVVGFPILEYWLDIGQHAEYQQASRDVEEGCVTS